jgi:hypothetical protein
MVKLAKLALVSGFIVCSLAFLMAGSAYPIAAQGKQTPTAAPNVLFQEDFATRANRWRLFNLGKATINYEQSALVMRAEPGDYAVWSIPDNDLKLERFDIQTEFIFDSSDPDSRVGLIISYHSESDMLVLAASPQGNVYLGRYYFGIWSDVLPPTKVAMIANQPIMLRATVNGAHMLKVAVNNHDVGQTTLTDVASTFGLFGLTGQHGGLKVQFKRLVVSQFNQ